SARAHSPAVPAAVPRVRNAAVIAPVLKIRRFRNPDIVPAKLRTARTMQRIVAVANPFGKQRAVFVMRRKYHPAPEIALPILRTPQANAYPVFRNLRIGQKVDAVYLCYPAIFNAKGF